MTERPFEALGLSADADRAYGLLMANRGVAVGELARKMSVSTERARAACEELAVHALIRLGRDDRWYPLPPHAGLLPLLYRVQEQIRRGRELLDQLGVQYQRVHEGHRAEDVVRIIEGAEAVRRRVDETAAAAREELLIFAGGTEIHASAAGVRCRVVVERAVLETGGWSAGGAGAEIRIVERLPLQLCVADRAAALVPLTSDGLPQDSLLLVVTSGGLLDGLVRLFESIWIGGVPLAPADGTRDTLQDRILAMLVMGSTDAAMARSLGVAVRTVQRRIAAMQRAAGVDNRIQLVWHVARYGWLDK